MTPQEYIEATADRREKQTRANKVTEVHHLLSVQHRQIRRGILAEENLDPSMFEVTPQGELVVKPINELVDFISTKQIVREYNDNRKLVQKNVDNPQVVLEGVLDLSHN